MLHVRYFPSKEGYVFLRLLTDNGTAAPPIEYAALFFPDSGCWI